MNMCKKYFVSFMYLNGNAISYGSYNITQSEYMPITPDVLEDAKSLIKKDLRLNDDVKMTILSWSRYEAE